jgi:hypothetical protein
MNCRSEDQDRFEIPIEAVDNHLQNQAKYRHLTSDRKLGSPRPLLPLFWANLGQATSPTNQVSLLILAMESGCHYEDCQSETILFCGGCRKWFCKKHFVEHRELIRQLKARAIFPALEAHLREPAKR